MDYNHKAAQILLFFFFFLLGYEMGFIFFPFQNNIKNLESSCKLDLDFWNCFRSETPISKHFKEFHKTGLDIWGHYICGK